MNDMRLYTLDQPGAQVGIRCTRSSGEHTPYRQLWTLSNLSVAEHALTMPADLEVHLVFDVSGLAAVEPEFWITGARCKRIELPAGCAILGISFGLEQAGVLFDMPAPDALYTSERVQPRLDLDWAWTAYYLLLERRNRHAETIVAADVFAWFDSAIAATLEQRHAALFERLAAGRAPGEVAFSPRHLRRLFSTYLGLSPHAYRRIVRLDQALRHFEATGSFDWDGYTDQSHFIREFRQLCGTTPGRYAQAWRL